MKVLVISATFPPMRSGGADYAFWLCQELAGRGFDVHVVTSVIENVATDPKMRVYPVMRRWSWKEMPRLLQIARRVRPDIINLHFSGNIYHDHPMVTVAPTFLKRLLPGVSVVTHIEYPNEARVDLHGRAARAARRLAVRLAGRRDVTPGYGTILRDSDTVIVLSDTHRAMLRDHFPRVDEKSVFIPPPPNLLMRDEAGGAARRCGREMLRAATDEFLFIYFGYIYPQKGLETLLEAFRLVAQRNEKARLIMVGGSNEVMLKTINRPRYAQELYELAEQAGVADRVQWTGYCPPDSDQASLYLRAADACTLPFTAGVYMNNSSFAAAAAHGLPLISTRAEIVETALVDGKNVLLCPPQNPVLLAAAMDSVINDAGLRQRLRVGALELTREWFSWDKVMERTLVVFAGPGKSEPSPIK